MRQRLDLARYFEQVPVYRDFEGLTEGSVVTDLLNRHMTWWDKDRAYALKNEDADPELVGQEWNRRDGLRTIYAHYLYETADEAGPEHLPTDEEAHQILDLFDFVLSCREWVHPDAT